MRFLQSFLGLLLLLVASPEKGDWTQWRGSKSDGSVQPDLRPDRWPANLIRLWEREVGEGYSGPISAGETVWVHSRRGEQEVVSSLGLLDGRSLWTRAYPVPFRQDPDARGHGRGPYSTPTVAAGRLFTLSVTSLLSVWKADSGDLLWRADYSKEFQPSHPYFGASASPLVWEDLCFVHFGHMGGDEPDRGAIVALAVEGGMERWRWNGDGPAVGASPVIHNLEDKPHLVFKTQEYIVSLDPRSGKELWRIPFEVPTGNTIVTPFLIGNRLFTSDDQNGFHAWRIRRRGEKWEVEQLFRHRQVSMYTSSPVLVSEQIVGFSQLRKGQLFGLDPQSGRVLWRGDGRWGEHASLIAWGDQILAFKDDGTLVIGVVGPTGLEVLRRYRVGSSPLWSHPAITRGRILVRHGDRLTAYGWEREQGSNL